MRTLYRVLLTIDDSKGINFKDLFSRFLLAGTSRA